MTTPVKVGVVDSNKELTPLDKITDPESQIEFCDLENPYLKNGLNHRERNSIRKVGTPFQRKWLKELEESEINEKEKAYREQFKTPYVAPEKRQQSIEEISQRMIEEITNRGVAKKIPDDEMFRRARLLLYDAYRAWVYQRTSKEPIVEQGDEISTALSLIAHWLVGLEEWKGKGKPRRCLDPRKSLYLCGQPGNGKSSIAIATASASMKLYQHYGVGEHIKYTSMNQVVTKIMTSGSLAPLEQLSEGGLVLDELRLEHLTHKHYGNDLDIMADVLLHRWESWNYLRHQTIITSNITPAKLAENIADDSERVRSRIRDQFQILRFTGPSFRAPKQLEYDLSASE